METLLLLTYTAIMTVIFKVFQVPLNKWTVPAAALGGVVLVGTLVFAMNYNHPHSRNGIIGFVTAPIVPDARGLVNEVPAKPNVEVKKGDVLFKIDPTPYQAVVDQKKAALDAAIAAIDKMPCSASNPAARRRLFSGRARPRLRGQGAQGYTRPGRGRTPGHRHDGFGGALQSRGLVPVTIQITDDISKFRLPDGTAAMVSIYSKYAHHVAVMRKILLRLKSWEHYIYLDHSFAL